MVERGTALVPTIMQLDMFPEHAAAGAERFPTYAETMTELYARMPATIMAAYDAGVPIYAGSDGGGISRHGNIAGEVAALHRIGIPARDALGAASWRAREWLGPPGTRGGRARRLRGVPDRPRRRPLGAAPPEPDRAARRASSPDPGVAVELGAARRRTPADGARLLAGALPAPAVALPPTGSSLHSCWMTTPT